MPTGRVAARTVSRDYEEKISKISLKRAILAPNISNEKGVVNPRLSINEKIKRLDVAMMMLQKIRGNIH